jgi:isoleucyl-tRNA synthetase
VTEEGIREGVRQFLLPLWSTYYFLSLYVGDHTPVWRTDSTHVLDRYILAKTKNLIQVTTQEFEALDSPMAAAALRDFADVLTNWYVRRSRERFWDGTDKDALDTLYTVLETISRLAAPLAPLVTEEVWRGLTGGESVHLTDWPEESEFPGDDDLVSAMDTVRDVASAGLALRKAHGLRVRLPLNTLTIVTEGVAGVEGFLDILADELNVKEVTTRELDDQVATELGIGKKLLPQSRVLGPRVGSQVQSIIQAAKAGDWSLEGGVVTVAGIALEEGEYVLEFTSEGEDTAVQFLGSGGFVLLDTTVTPELAAEGLARDVIRAIQQERKNAGLEVSDRIQTVLEVDEVAGDAIRTHQDLIASETLSLGIELTELADTEGALAVGENSKIRVKVSQSV